MLDGFLQEKNNQSVNIWSINTLMKGQIENWGI
jgi:hypothetical protein